MTVNTEAPWRSFNFHIARVRKFKHKEEREPERLFASGSRNRKEDWYGHRHFL